jgi:hypothetical protein
MNETTNVQKLTGKEARENVKQQLAAYVAQQPEGMQSFHRWMNRLEAAGVGIIAAAFIAALYLSFAWKSIDPILIPAAWFIFAASGSVLFVLNGLHSAILRAFPAGSLPGSKQKFVTGSGAMWAGLAFIVGGLAYAAFWMLFAYATWTANFEILRPLIGFLGIVMGIGMAVAMIVGMVNTTVRNIRKSH